MGCDRAGLLLLPLCSLRPAPLCRSPSLPHLPSVFVHASQHRVCTRLNSHHVPVALLGEVVAGVQLRDVCSAVGLCVRAARSSYGDGLGARVAGQRVGLGEVEELLEGQVAQLGVLRMRRAARPHMLVVVRDNALQPPLILRNLQEVHVERLQRDQAVHGHGALLPEAVRAVHGLDVLLRILRVSASSGTHPVRVVEDHRVGGAEVDAQPARARG